MNRSEAWAALAKDSAKRAGFAPLRWPMVGESFSLEAEVAPSLQVFFQRVGSKEVAPEVFLGIYVEAFETQWRDRLVQTALPPEFESPPFGIHIANVASLRPRPWSPLSPSGQDVAAVRDWLDRAFEYAKRLPSSMDSLVTAVQANRIVDHNVEAYLGHPVKMRGFVEWLRRTHGVDLGGRVLPLLSDRTEPYDLQAMLGAR